MRYCPACGSEYRPGFDVCADCGTELVDEPTATANPAEDGSAAHHWIPVHNTGRSMDAELVRSYLEGNGLTAEVWSSGLGRWRMESAITEVTGVPNDFSAFRVMVPDDQVEAARALLAQSEEVSLAEEDWNTAGDTFAERDDFGDTGAGYGVADREPIRWMTIFRSRWVLTGVALFTLVLIVMGTLGR
jgi:hypothetical protein